MAKLNPEYHVRAAENWINDPNGPIHWMGKYHLFFQRHASSTDWGPTSWGHAVSDDLARWTVLDDAFGPTPGSHDADGTWSGTTVSSGDMVHAFYTGVSEGREVVCSAVSSHDLTSWSKNPTPILDTPPLGHDSSGWRDPFVFRANNEWLCLVGSGTRGGSGTALIYRSEDLSSWDYLGSLCDNAPDTPGIVAGEMWECPMLFDLGTKYLFGVSAWQEGKQLRSLAMLGEYKEYSFVPESLELIDYGPAFYAPSATQSPDGRVLMWGWSWDLLRRGPRQEQGLAGALTITRVVSVNDAGDLIVEPAQEVAGLRESLVGSFAGPLNAESASLLWPVGEQWELEVEVESGNVVVALGEGSSAGSKLTVDVDVPSGLVTVVTAYSAEAEGRARDGGFQIPLLPGSPIRLRILADGSLFEVFANGRAATTRYYPLAGPRCVELNSGSLGKVIRSELWSMESGLSFRFGALAQDPS